MATNAENATSVNEIEEEKKLFIEVPANDAQSNATNVKNDLVKKTPPDGGYGWVVLFAVFSIGLILDAIMYSFGAILNAMKQYYSIDDKTANLLMSLYTGLFLMSGPIVSAIINQFGCQVAIIIGAFVTSLMFFISVFLPSFYYMYITIGIVGGIATGIFYIASLVIIPEYFDKKKGVATGIAMCGSGFGFFIGPPIITDGINKFGWQKTFVVCSACIMINAFLGILTKPLNPPKSNIAFWKKKKVIEEVNIDVMSGSITSLKKENKENKESVFLRTIKNIGDFSLLCKNWRFLCVAFANLLVFCGYFVPYLYLNQIPKNHNIDESLTKWIVSISGIVNIPSRLIFGLLGDKRYVSPIMLNTLCLAFGILPILAYEQYLQYQFWTSALFSALYAVSTSGILVVTSLYLLDFVGMEDFSNAMGIVSLFRGFGCLLGPLIAGVIADKWGAAMAFYFVAGTFLLGFVFSAIPTFLKTNEIKNEDIELSEKPVTFK